MREIKFRGKDIWANWRYGDLIKNSIPTASPVIVEDFYYDDPDDSMFEVNPDTVGQFTGLRDAEGHEIYEGDIVKTYNGSISVVIWDDATHGWREMANGIKCRFAPGELAKAYTVVGNIHDDPDLVGVSHAQSD